MNYESQRWKHIDKYEQRYLVDAMNRYDLIMESNDDIPQIANQYNLTREDVKRAKDYAFGMGVSKYQFCPDILMAQTWQRLATGKGTPIDEVFLRHEIHESNLVINQEIPQQKGHELTQKLYPWSDLVQETRKL
jgi:hypothetical protein